MEKKYDNNGRVSVWAKVAEKSGVQYLSGQVEIDGVIYNLSLFDNDKATSEKSPIMTGTLKKREAR